MANPLCRLLELPEQEKVERGLEHTPREIWQQPDTWKTTYQVCGANQTALADVLRRAGIGRGSTSSPAVYLIGAGTSDYNGLAASSGQGAATISASSNSISGSTTITVSSPALVSIAITPNSAAITAGVLAGTHRTAPAPVTVPATLTAREVLEHAAAAALKEPAVVPRDDQFVYQHAAGGTMCGPPR